MPTKIPTTPQELWEYIQEDKSRFNQINTIGKKTYLQYGYDNHFLTEQDLTEDSINKTYVNPAQVQDLTIAKPQVATVKNDRQKKTVVQQGKVAPANLKRPDNPFAPAFVNFANTMALGALERNTDAIDKLREKAPVSSTLGSMAGYAALYALTGGSGAGIGGAATKGISNPFAKRVIGDAITGMGIDAATEAVKGKNDIKTAAKNTAMGAIYGIGADLGLSVLGKIGSSILKKLGNGNALNKAELDAIETLPEEAKKKIKDILYVDPYGNVRTKPETDLLLPAPKQNLPKAKEIKTLTKTVGEPEKTAIVNKPFENTINKVSIRKTPKPKPLIKEFDSQSGKITVIDGKIHVKDKVVDGNKIYEIKDAPKYILDAIKKGNVDVTGRVYFGGAVIPKEIAEEALSQQAIIRKISQDKLNNNVPGLDILRDAIRKNDENYYKFKTAVERGDGVLPSGKKIDLQELYEKYPRAKAYLKAESYSNSNNFEKAAAGKKAMEDILAGGDIDIIMKNMDSEWSNAARSSVMELPQEKFIPQNPFTKTETIIQKGTQKTSQIIPSTLKQQGQTLKPNKPIKSALDARLNKPTIASGKNIEAPFRLTPAEKNRIDAPQLDIQPEKVSSNINTLPMQKKSLTGQINGEAAIAKGSNVARTTKKTTIEQVLENGKKERKFAQTVKASEQTDPALKEMLEKDVLSYDVLKNKETESKAAIIYSKGYDTAKDVFDNYVKFGKQYEPDKVVLGEMLSRDAAKAGNLRESYNIIGDLASKLTEAGQFIQAVKILHKSEPEGMLKYLNNEIGKINKEGLKRFGEKWKSIDLTDAEIKMIQDTRGMDEAAKEAAMEAVAKSIAQRVPSTTMDKINAWRRMAMLLNPRTHIRNIGGNLIYSPIRRADEAIAQAFELLRKPENRTKAIGWSKDADLVNIVNSDWEKNGKTYMQGSGTDRFDFGRVLGQQKTIFKNKALEGLNKKSFELLEKGDIPFFKAAYTDALGQYMKAQKLKEVTDTARQYALKKAEEATYRDLNTLSELFIGVKKKAGVLGEAALPFAKTPANITMRAFEHSPAGILTTFGRAANQARKGTFDATQFIDGLAKGMTGSAIIGTGFMLHKMGVLTGAPDKDKDKANFEKAIGKVPYAVKMGNNYYSYDWAQPIGALIAMGAAMNEALQGEPEKQQKVIDNIIKEKNKPGAGQVTYDMIAAGGDTLFNMSMLQSVRRMFGNSYDSPTQALLETILQYPRQGLPTLLGQAAQASDPYERQIDYSKKLGEGLLEYGKSRTPGLRQQLPAKVNIKGEEMKTPGNSALSRAAYSFLSPAKIGEYKSNAVDNEITRLYNAERDKTIFPRTSPTQFTYNKTQYKLSVAEQNELQKLIGKNQYELLDNLFKSPAYKMSPDKLKIKAITNTLDKAVEKSKMEYIRKKGIK